MELLLVVAVIGLLSTVGTTSYESARRQSRDVKRVSDVKQIQVALEIFFEGNGFYPPDGRIGVDPSILTPEDPSTALSLTDAGFSTEPTGRIYMQPIPVNPVPGGTPYAYRSIQRDGRDCNGGRCEAYAILFTTEGMMGSLEAGSHAITPEGVAGGGVDLSKLGVTTAGGQVVGLQFAQDVVQDAVARTAGTVGGFLGDARVEQVAEKGIAPAAVLAALANIGATAQATASGSQVILSLLTQPFLLFSRRKRAQWGTVYNTLSRLPTDLAIIRLLDDATGSIVRSAVTDNDGRYAFLISTAGRYRIEVIKKGIVFPSKLLKGAAQDKEHETLYHGASFEVGAEGAFVHPDIPVDPETREASDTEAVQGERKKRTSRNIALIGPVFGGLSLLVAPKLLVLLLFAAQVIVYRLFRRLAVPTAPKSWGIVHEESKRTPVPQAVLRIFESKYDKLLETQVTDARGRYHFRVGRGIYYLTVTKQGFVKTQSEIFDLSAREGVTVIASDLPLRRMPSS
jgi:type II secretory pathway pseudopilin PulG